MVEVAAALEVEVAAALEVEVAAALEVEVAAALEVKAMLTTGEASRDRRAMTGGTLSVASSDVCSQVMSSSMTNNLSAVRFADMAMFDALRQSAAGDEDGNADNVTSKLGTTKDEVGAEELNAAIENNTVPPGAPGIAKPLVASPAGTRERAAASSELE